MELKITVKTCLYSTTCCGWGLRPDHLLAKELRRWSAPLTDWNTDLFIEQERGHDLNDSPVTTLTAVPNRDDRTWTKSSLFPLEAEIKALDASLSFGNTQSHPTFPHPSHSLYCSTVKNSAHSAQDSSPSEICVQQLQLNLDVSLNDAVQPQESAREHEYWKSATA